MRQSWEGYLQLSLISIPVRAFNVAAAGQGDIHFHQLHKGCGGRIRYKKVCEIDGQELSASEIVSGYEYKKGQYVEIDRDEIRQARAEKDDLISIDTFVASEQIDPVYLSGKSFYLIPDGPAGQKSYDLLTHVMQEKNRCAIARIVLGGHEEVVLIRPIKNLLIMSVLYLQQQLRMPTEFEEMGSSKLSAQEITLAGSLIEASTSSSLDLSQYKDEYTQRVRELLDAKLAGKSIDEPVAGQVRPAVNLMDALRKSLKRTGTEPPGARKSRRATIPIQKKRRAS